MASEEMERLASASPDVATLRVFTTVTEPYPDSLDICVWTPEEMAAWRAACKPYQDELREKMRQCLLDFFADRLERQRRLNLPYEKRWEIPTRLSDDA